MKFALVVACDKDLGIGIENRLPWRLKGDQKNFRKLTASSSPGRQNAVIMGRKTWESLPEPHRPLADRLNIVITRNQDYATKDGALVCASLEKALKLAESHGAEHAFVIGGEQIYQEALKHKDLEKIFLTEINASFACDTYFPRFQDKFKEVSAETPISENGIEYTYKIFEVKK